MKDADKIVMRAEAQINVTLALDNMQRGLYCDRDTARKLFGFSMTLVREAVERIKTTVKENGQDFFDLACEAELESVVMMEEFLNDKAL